MRRSCFFARKPRTTVISFSFLATVSPADLVAKVVGSLWHLSTRHRLDEKDQVSFIIHRKAKIVDVQNFLRIQPRG